MYNGARGPVNSTVMHMKVEYKEDGPMSEFTDIDTCLEFISSLERSSNRPIGVFLYNTVGECISCVIGANTTSFVYYPVGYDGHGSWSSKGETEVNSDLSFWLCGHHTEATSESQVSSTLLEPVIVDFLKNGGKTNQILWTKD